MNKLIKLSAVCLIAVSFLVAGCKTPTQTQNAQVAVTTAAQLGTVAYLQKNPQDAPYFTGAQKVLTDLSTSTNLLDVETVQDALVASGKTNSPVVDLVVADAVNLGNIYIQNNTSTNIVTQSAAAKQVCGWIATGIGEGLVFAGK